MIASSSSAISVTDMQSACARPERVVRGHPSDPPQLVPLVELAGGRRQRYGFWMRRSASTPGSARCRSGCRRRSTATSSTAFRRASSRRSRPAMPIGR
ncbi:3-hydroxyacyl-CoA dehydrogenase NAD-binding domain-containing protein [Alloyangia pacifica]|uniref:3-hydroxyacyl-CoA dehydrogenase NAD-binding domain-containing protein n=1 Tax=Alloyangia pacifica TaxID=311180 RepID=UPI0034A0B507